MHISAVVAMSENRVIGKDNRLPWHLPADLQHFKKITLGKPILMGRKTFESIGCPLPLRRNIVVTRDENFQAPGCVVVHSVEEGIQEAAYSKEICVIGGAILFAEMLPTIQKIYLTMVHHLFVGDAYFPELDMNEWREVERERHDADEKNVFAYSFIVLERK